MKFETPNKDVSFEIPGDWWEFCEMESFKAPNGDGSYYPYCSRMKEVEVVSLSSVEPPARKKGVPLFRKCKLVPVLLAFKSPERMLPPVQVEETNRTDYEYKVVNGYHRYYGSIAVGYQFIPIKVVEHVA